MIDERLATGILVLLLIVLFSIELYIHREK
jgi:hypothetical protein